MVGGRQSCKVVHKDPEDDQSENIIFFFYAHSESYGGPFGFLSNFYASEIYVLTVCKTIKFSTVEHYYQFQKARCRASVPARDNREHLSSKLMPYWIVMCKTPNDAASIGRSFNYLRKTGSREDFFSGTWRGGSTGRVESTKYFAKVCG